MLVANKVQSKMTSYLKKWLKLATLSSLFHPDVLNLPYLPHQLEKAKLCFLAAISMSQDQNINSLASLINDPQFVSQEQIPSNTKKVVDSHQLPTKKVDLKHLYHALHRDHATHLT